MFWKERIHRLNLRNLTVLILLYCRKDKRVLQFHSMFGTYNNRLSCCCIVGRSLSQTEQPTCLQYLSRRSAKDSDPILKSITYRCDRSSPSQCSWWSGTSEWRWTGRSAFPRSSFGLPQQPHFGPLAPPTSVPPGWSI